MFSVVSHGAKTFETCSRNERVDIEDNNDDVEHMTCTSEAATSFLANPKASSHSSAECYSPGASSYFYEGKKSGRGFSCDARLNISDTLVNVSNYPFLMCIDGNCADWILY